MSLFEAGRRARRAVGHLILVVVLALGAPGVSAQFRLDPLQAQFLRGMAAMARGDYVTAVHVLADLAQRTPSARVRLELARALYLDRRYPQARAVFEQVRAREDVPPVVRENIDRFLDAIADATGYLRFAAAVVTDSNPRNFTDSRQITILGQTLTVVPPADNEPITGMRYTLAAGQALSDDAAWLGYVQGQLTDYEGSAFDRVLVDAGVSYAPRRYRKWKGKAGLEASTLDGRLSYHFVYTGLRYTPDPSDMFRFANEFRLGRLRVPDARQYDAWSMTYTAFASRQLSANALISGDAYGEAAFTEERPYSYRGVGANLRLVLVPAAGWRVQLDGGLGLRRYQDVEPFFGVQREDRRTRLGFTLSNRRFKLFGMVPEVGARWERNHSNIDYYAYRDVGFVFELKGER